MTESAHAVETPNEIWRDVLNYEGYYQVSSKARVRSLDRVVKHGKRTLRLRGRVLSPMRRPGIVYWLSKDGTKLEVPVREIQLQVFDATEIDWDITAQDLIDGWATP